VDETVTDAQNSILARFEPLFRAKYKGYLSRSAQPRRPNVNLDHIKNTLYRNRATLLEALPTAESLMAYVDWVNAQLLSRYVSPDLRDRALQKSQDAPLVLAHDVDGRWAEDERWLQAYLSGSEDTPPLEHEPAARIRITQAMRRALWMRDFGERRAVGDCAVCGTEILYMNFDVGHVRAVARGGSTEMGNLAAICRPCNLGMGTANLHDFRATHYATARDVEARRTAGSPPCERPRG
jgi:hypothetical protein